MFFTKETGTHSHSTNLCTQKKINNAVKHEAVEKYEEYSKSIAKAQHNSSLVDKITSKDVKLIRDIVSRTRVKCFPKLPKSINEIHDYTSKTNLVSV